MGGGGVSTRHRVTGLSGRKGGRAWEEGALPGLSAAEEEFEKQISENQKAWGSVCISMSNNELSICGADLSAASSVEKTRTGGSWWHLLGDRVSPGGN